MDGEYQSPRPDIDLSAAQRIKLIFLRPHITQNDLSVTIGVNPEKKEALQVELIDFFNFVNAREGWIHKADDILDSETHQPSDLHVTIAGDQRLLAQEFQNRIPKFAEHSKWIQ
jgi:hypothetical protein